MGWWTSVGWAAPFTCDVPLRLQTLDPSRVAVGPPSTLESLELRDPFATFSDVTESEHFAFKSGPNDTYSAAVKADILEAAEEGWVTAFDELDFTRPSFTNSYKVNIYAGNSGGGAPSISFDGGYTTLDGDGYAYVVLSPSVVSSFEGSSWDRAGGASVVKHEFHHVVQYGAGAYWDYDAGWYWEASASWFEWVAEPNGSWIYFPSYYLFMPQHPVDLMDYGSSGLESLHQYAAALFLISLDDPRPDDQLIRDSWVVGDQDAAPLSVLHELLEDEGSDLGQAFESFALSNAAYAYSFGDDLEYVFEYEQDYFGSYDDSVVASWTSLGSADPVRPEPDLEPGSFGYNVFDMDAPGGPDLHVVFVADAEGSRGSPSDFALALVVERGGAREVVSLPLDGGATDTWLQDVEDWDFVRLVVMSKGAITHDLDETFSYSVAMSPGIDPVGDTDTGGPAVDTDVPSRPEEPADAAAGCACSTAAPGGGGLGWASVLVALASWRRRR